MEQYETAVQHESYCTLSGGKDQLGSQYYR